VTDDHKKGTEMEAGKRTDSRYDMNRQVKMILVRHGVDLTLLKWSSSRSTVNFYGMLKKDQNKDFTVTELEGLVKELVHVPRAPRLNFNLDNWYISSESGSWKVSKRKMPVSGGGVEDRPRTVFIRRTEKVEDILREIRERKESQRSAKRPGT